MRYMQLTFRCEFEPDIEARLLEAARKLYAACEPVLADDNKPIPPAEFIDDVESAVMEILRAGLSVAAEGDVALVRQDTEPPTEQHKQRLPDIRFKPGTKTGDFARWYTDEALAVFQHVDRVRLAKEYVAAQTAIKQAILEYQAGSAMAAMAGVLGSLMDTAALAIAKPPNEKPV